MNRSNPVSILVASVFLTLLALKVRESCTVCFIGLFCLGLILFIFGIVKYLKGRHG